MKARTDPLERVEFEGRRVHVVAVLRPRTRHSTIPVIRNDSCSIDQNLERTHSAEPSEIRDHEVHLRFARVERQQSG